MSDINHVILIGRLTRDGELKYTSGGMAVCKFSIAVNRKKKSGEQWVDEASFFDVVLWGKSGEAVNQYLTKGKQVAVEGELHQNRWEQEGQSRSKIEINANNVQLLGGNDKPQGVRPSQNQKSPAERRQEFDQQIDRAEAGRKQAGTEDSAPPDFPDDIPF